MCLGDTSLDSRLQLPFEISPWVFPGPLTPNRAPVNFNFPIPNPDLHPSIHHSHKSKCLITQVKTMMLPSTLLFPSFPAFIPSASPTGFTSKTFLSTSFHPKGRPVQGTSFWTTERSGPVDHLDHSLLVLFLFLFLTPFKSLSMWQPECSKSYRATVSVFHLQSCSPLSSE